MEHRVTPRPAPQHKRLCAVLPAAAGTEAPRPAEVVFPWLVAEAHQRDPDHQQTWVLLMDGQPALWEAAAATLGEVPRVEILDLLHATGYLWEAVHLFQPPGSEQASQLTQVLVHTLLVGLGIGVLLGLQDQARQHHWPAARQTRLAQIYAYFDRHRHRIRYPEYLAADYPIASGVIEGASAVTWSRTVFNGPVGIGRCPAHKRCLTSTVLRSTTSGRRS